MGMKNTVKYSLPSCTKCGCGALGGRERVQRIKKMMSSSDQSLAASLQLPLQMQNRGIPYQLATSTRQMDYYSPDLEARKVVYRCIMGQKHPVMVSSSQERQYSLPSEFRLLFP